MAETTSPAADPSYRGGHHYEVPLPSYDWATRRLEQAQKARADQYPDEDTSGLVWSVIKVIDQ